MRFLTRYFDSLADPLFKTDAQGRQLYFPVGVLARGRVLPGEAEAVAMRRNVRRAYVAFFLVLIPLVGGLAPFISSGNWPGMVAVGAGAATIFQVYLMVLARGLPFAQERLTIGDAQRVQAQALGRGWLRALIAASMVLMLGGIVAMVFDQSQSPWIGFSAAAFFGVLTVVFWRQMRMLGMSRA